MSWITQQCIPWVCTPNWPDLRLCHYCGGWRQLVITRQLTTLHQDTPDSVHFLILIHQMAPQHELSRFGSQNLLVSSLESVLISEDESLRSLKSALSHGKKHFEGLIRHCRDPRTFPDLRSNLRIIIKSPPFLDNPWPLDIHPRFFHKSSN